MLATSWTHDGLIFQKSYVKKYFKKKLQNIKNLSTLWIESILDIKTKVLLGFKEEIISCLYIKKTMMVEALGEKISKNFYIDWSKFKKYCMRTRKKSTLKILGFGF